MSRFDKYEPFAGGFRAPLAADFDPDDYNTAFGVGLDVNGRVVLGGGVTGILGVLVLQSRKVARDVIDVMTSGDIVEFGGGVAGTVYYADATTGALSTTNTGTRVGHTVEGSRLVVRVVPLAAA